MKRLGIQWDRARIEGRTYVHVGLYVDSPTKQRTTTKVAAFITAVAFGVFMLWVFPDVDTAPTANLTEVQR